MGGFLRQYAWVIDLVGILLCSFFLARITGVYLGESMQVKRSIGVLSSPTVETVARTRSDLASYRIIEERNIFDSTDRTPDVAEGEEGETVVEEDKTATGEAVPTSLDISVMGVLVVGNGRDKRSTATIASKAKAAPKAKGRRRKKSSASAAKVYAVGDEESFAPNTKMTLVQPDRIEFLHNGRLEFAEVGLDEGKNIFGPPTRAAAVASSEAAPKEEETLIRKEAAGKFTVDQREINSALENLDKLYTEIRAVPNFANGKVSGMKILSVKRGSIFAKLGMRRGDVLKRINGMELDVKRGFEIFNTLKDEKSITLDLIRQGQPTTVEYEIR